MHARFPLYRWLAAARLTAVRWHPVVPPRASRPEQDITPRRSGFIRKSGAGVWRVLSARPRWLFITSSLGAACSSLAMTNKSSQKFPSLLKKGYRGAPPLVYGVAFDVDSTGRVYVADRAANILRIFSPDGDSLLNISFQSPTGIAVLPSGEIAAAGSSTDHLITIFDARGRELRSIGDQMDFTDNRMFNRFLSPMSATWSPIPPTIFISRSTIFRSRLSANTIAPAMLSWICSLTTMGVSRARRAGRAAVRK